jgi:hypothetical protein
MNAHDLATFAFGFFTCGGLGTLALIWLGYRKAKARSIEALADADRKKNP